MRHIGSIFVTLVTATAAAPHTYFHTRDTTEQGVVHMELIGGPVTVFSGDIPVDGSWHPVNTKGQSVSRVHNTWNNTVRTFSCWYYPDSAQGDFHSGTESWYNLGTPKVITQALCAYADK